MKQMKEHPVLGQLSETDCRLTTVEDIRMAMAERRRVMERDGKLTTIVAGLIGISGLFFMQRLPFFLVLGLLLVGLPLVWRHLVKEAREFVVSDEEIKTILEEEKK